MFLFRIYDGLRGGERRQRELSVYGGGFDGGDREEDKRERAKWGFATAILRLRRENAEPLDWSSLNFFNLSMNV